MNVIYKVFNDAVHGHMLFHPLLVEMINTVEVQRLRNLKQTGFAYYVYPAASHNRFEHSLGTCHLAGKLLITLQKSTIADVYRPTEEEILCVQIAGLCHDLGHGPFSHTWEQFIHKADPNSNWTHEKSSIEMMERMMNNRRIREKMTQYNLTDRHIQLIKDIIQVPDKLDNPKRYLYQIVSNKDNDVDVDKWDYILRDQKQLNITNSFDVGRIIEYSQIILVRRNRDQAEICFRDKEVQNIYNMLLARAMLHLNAYQHRVVKTVEIMVLDAFQEAHAACPEWNLTDTSPDHLLTLSDSIFDKILFSTELALKKARDLLHRVQIRQLYKCVAEVDVLDQDIENDKQYLQDCGDKVYNLICYKNINNNVTSHLRRGDIEVIQVKIDMGSKYSANGLNCFKFEKGSRVAKIFNMEDNNHFLTRNLTQVLTRKLLVLYKGTDDFDMSLVVGIDHAIKKGGNTSNGNSSRKRKAAKVEVKEEPTEKLVDIDE